jgi:hypothetical protein
MNIPLRFLEPGRRFARLALIALALSGCAAQAVRQSWVSDQLYFGLSSPQGQVSEADWKSFLADTVTPRFPEGLTAWDAQGQWKDDKGMIGSEPSKVLELVHAMSQENERKIGEIIELYKQRFHQQSVLRLKSVTAASF